MATHNVTFTAPNVQVMNKDIEFIVKKDDRKLGTLKISKGNIEWLPADNLYAHKMNWTKFAELMEENGKKKQPVKK